MEKFDEGNTLYMSISPRDMSGAPVIPESMQYRIMAHDDTELVEITNLPVDTTVLEIPPAINTIGETGPLRYVTLIVKHNNGKTIVHEQVYQLNNLIGI